MYADAIIPCILIAQFIGRWGNYFNGEVFGGNITDEHFA
ncbi:MAG: prolipoprotein diacylglyceryl transferase [Mycoplasmoidaceae bacterium]|nr:prolipoprotein diacylglyceryl transferase [Mycoplasmoidaceae bacterium]